MERLNGLDLFSGIGGNTLGLRKYVKTIAYCERDRHAQSVLLSRMSDGLLEWAPIWDDISTLSGKHFDTPIDIIVGGFPCQDISIAGHGIGLEGKRSGLFYQIVRLAKELKPKFLFLENVPAIRTRGLERVIEELTEAGYDCRWRMLSAYDMGAPHIRKRWFLLAYSKSFFGRVQQVSGFGIKDTSNPRDDGAPQYVADADDEGQPRLPGGTKQKLSGVGTSCESRTRNTWWQVEPDVGRVADGVPFRVDRLKRLGNAVVPCQAREAFESLMGISIIR